MTNEERARELLLNKYDMGSGVTVGYTTTDQSVLIGRITKALDDAEDRGEKKAARNWGTSHDYRRGLLRGAEIFEELKDMGESAKTIAKAIRAEAEGGGDEQQ